MMDHIPYALTLICNYHFVLFNSFTFCGFDARDMTMSELITFFWCTFLTSVKWIDYSIYSLKCASKNLPDLLFYFKKKNLLIF